MTSLEERILEHALREVFDDDASPDLTGRILEAWARGERGSASEDDVSPVAPTVPRRRWPVRAAAALVIGTVTAVIVLRGAAPLEPGPVPGIARSAHPETALTVLRPGSFRPVKRPYVGDGESVLVADSPVEVDLEGGGRFRLEPDSLATFFAGDVAGLTLKLGALDAFCARPGPMDVDTPMGRLRLATDARATVHITPRGDHMFNTLVRDVHLGRSAVVLFVAITLAHGQAELRRSGKSTPLVAGETVSATVPQEKPDARRVQAALLREVGTWRATVTTTNPTTGKTQKSRGVEVNRKGPGGRWLLTTYEGEMLGRHFDGFGQLGFDPTKGKLIGTWLDSRSDVMTHTHGVISKDLKTRKLFSTSEWSGRKFEQRSVTTWESKTKRRTVWSVKMPDTGEWRELMTIVLERDDR